MKRLIALASFGLLVVGCDTPTTPAAEDLTVSPLFGKGPVVHQASMGGADLCEAVGLPTGCDANFSLVANHYADGSVSGQWEDSFGGGAGIHVAVDCLAVSGNQAVVGGVITHAWGGFEANEGQRALTSVVDNGTSANDPADQLSFSFFPVGIACEIDPTAFDPFLFDLTNGQVRVW